MKSAFRKLSALALGLTMLSAATPASAAFVGNLGLFANTSVPTDLATTNSYVFTGLTANTPAASVTSATGAFSPVPILTSYTTSTLNLLNLVGFQLGNGTYGTFTSIASDGGGNFSQIVSRSANFLDVYLIGNYVGLPSAPASTPASLRISINYSGGGIAPATFTLAVPPASVNPVPEPASVVMMGMGLVGLVGYGARRRSAQ